MGLITAAARNYGSARACGKERVIACAVSDLTERGLRAVARIFPDHTEAGRS
jgi:hypothetical protein